MNVNHVKFMVLALALAAITSLHGTEAEVYTTGGDMGWMIPPGGAATYASWASEYTFVVNEAVLVFNFEAGVHDVTVVSKEHFDTCNTTDPMFQVTDPQEATFGNSSPGTLYFTCSFAGHCAKGQKVAINYVMPPTPPSPSPCSSASHESATTSERKITMIMP